MELPHVAQRASCEMVVLSFDARIHQVIREFLGFGRDLPGAILDDSLLLRLKAELERGGVAGAVAYLRSAPRALRARARAVLMNLSFMRRENGGILPWER